MKKIYLTNYVFEQASLEETIEDDFQNFSLEGYHHIYHEDRGMFLPSVEEALNWKWYTDENINSISIIEYCLSEDDLFEYFLTDEMEVKPTNVWYYWWDPDQEKLKEIPKAFI